MPKYFFFAIWSSASSLDLRWSNDNGDYANYDGKISCFKGVEYKSCNTNENINNNNAFAQASPYTNNNFNNANNKQFTQSQYNGVEAIDNSEAMMGSYSTSSGVSYSYGYGTQEQASFQNTIQGQGTAEFSRNIYILSGTNQFIVYALEIFDIKIGKQRSLNSKITPF